MKRRHRSWGAKIEPVDGRPWYRPEAFKVALAAGFLAAVGGVLVGQLLDSPWDDDRLPPTTVPSPTTTSASTQPSDESTTTQPTATTVPPPPAALVRYLAEEEPVEDEIFGPKTRGGTADIAGNTYPKSVLVDYGTRFVQATASWNLSKRGGTFRAVIGLSDDSGSQARVRVEAVGDGRLLADATVGLGQAVPVNVSVDGVLRLTLRISSAATKVDQYLTAVWGNARIVAPGALDDPQP